MGPTRTPHSQVRARAFALGIGVVIALGIAATARPIRVHELCGECGARRTTLEVLGVSTSRTVEEHGWLGSLAGPEHQHGFLPWYSTGCGWAGTGIVCSRPAEAGWVQTFEEAHGALGDDPRLLDLARRYVNAAPEARGELAMAAGVLARE